MVDLGVGKEVFLCMAYALKWLIKNLGGLTGLRKSFSARVEWYWY